MQARKKILIVEDDSFNRYMIKSIIEALGVRLDVDVAADGLDGCVQVESAPDDYALILMDIHMPRLSGVDAAIRIRAHNDDPPRNIPIIAVTADQKYHHPLAAKAEGMDGFLAKPITPSELLALIDQYC